MKIRIQRTTEGFCRRIRLTILEVFALRITKKLTHRLLEHVDQSDDPVLWKHVKDAHDGVDVVLDDYDKRHCFTASGNLPNNFYSV